MIKYFWRGSDMDTKIKYVSDDRRYKIVIIILVSIIVLFYVAIPIYRKLYDKFFIYYKKENPSISTGIGLYGKPEKTSVYDEATGTYTVSYTVEYKINAGAPVVSFTCTYDFRDKDGVVQDMKTSNPVVINECPDDKLTIVFEKVRIDPVSYRSVDMNVVYAKSFYEEGLEKLSPFDRWLKENPWVWALFVVPYLIAMGVIMVATAKFLCADCDLKDKEFWKSVAAGVFWPIGAPILLSAYIKSEKEKQRKRIERNKKERTEKNDIRTNEEIDTTGEL